VAREERKLLELLKTLERERERERMLPGLIVGCLGQLQRSEAVGLVVIDEEDNQTLLVHRISADDIYRRQEDTIISWTDPEVATDLALSFQETMGCSFIWDQICNVQRLIHFPSVGGE
jgi:protein phosphatase-4 regulatory subunit 3